MTGMPPVRHLQRLVAGCAVLVVAAPCPAEEDSITWHLDNLEKIGGYPAIVVGDPVVIDAGTGRAVEFDGIDDGIFLDVHPLANADDFTVEIVFRPDRGGAAEQRFLHMQAADSASRVLIETRLTSDERWFLDTFIKSGEHEVVLYASDDEHPLDQWHHAAIVMQKGRMRHYVNGRLEESGDIPYAAPPGGRTSLGVRLNRVHWFKGAIRTVRYTRRALPPEQFLTASD